MSEVNQFLLHCCIHSIDFKVFFYLKADYAKTVFYTLNMIKLSVQKAITIGSFHTTAVPVLQLNVVSLRELEGTTTLYFHIYSI